MKKRNLLLRITALLLTVLLIGGLFWMGAGLTYQQPPSLPHPQALEIQPEAPAANADAAEPTQEPEETTQPPEETTEPPEDSTEPPEDATEPPEDMTEPPEGTFPVPPEQPLPPEQQPDQTVPPNGDTGETSPEEKDPDLPDENTDPGSGEPDENGGGTDVPTEGETDETKLQIITDLSNRTITFDQLENDTLPFYAYLINGGSKTLKVKLKNSATPQNGQYLTADGQNYTAKLQRKEVNYFTLYVKDGSTTVHEVTYRIRYMAQKADEDHPIIGAHPPTIETNLTEGMEHSTRNLTMTLRATDYHGKPIVSSNLDVRMDGKQITNPTGGPLYEYQLYFPNPTVGNDSHHRITITAWDSEGNSVYAAYNIIYHMVDTGDVIGTATIILDATTVGLGRLEAPFTYKIKQDEPASYAVLAMLKEYGYEASYSGTPDTGFYLKRIIRGGIMSYPDIPKNLWDKIKDDGLSLTGQSSGDSLGEFDFTQGSGWVYSIGGTDYAGKGLSNYFLSNGDTLYLRFTLAYGKDLGGHVDGDGFGRLPSYCGKWIDGGYIPMHRWDAQQHRDEPTCGQEGQVYELCTVCGEKHVLETLPATGEHEFEIVEQVDPADGNDGWILYRCIHCGAEKKEVIPWKGEETGPGEDTGPTENTDPPPVPEEP